MKNLFVWPLLLASLSCSPHSEQSYVYTPSSEVSRFSSSDTTVNNSYNWAKKMALSYSHDSLDPVGYWYEAALPQREAFCMRDVSHQSIGAEILGLKKHNKNMFTRFAENISESKDWCSYWEINRYNKPAPVDYESDSAFWYNLNANFDVMFACLKLFNWTGDSVYIKGAEFSNFFEKSMNDYIIRWGLAPDQIMSRGLFMNAPQPIDMENRFHTCRGLPSYVESFYDVTASADLIASAYAGVYAYAQMQDILGNQPVKTEYEHKAEAYRKLLDTEWWNDTTETYYTFRRNNKQVLHHESGPLLLWFNAAQDRGRIASTLANILLQEWNVENLSHFPVIYYKYNLNKEAYRYLNKLRTLPRADYPEVSFGVVEGIIGGYMGIAPNAATNKVITCPRLNKENDWAEVKDLPLLNGYMDVKHLSNSETQLKNNTSHTLTWKAMFRNTNPYCIVNSEKRPANTETDLLGNRLSYIEVEVRPGESINVISSL